ncbi:hypothetical protein [Prosthecobacter fusiformis]|nr:hypothetical protein [Prosthecobacter fusiformis]
MILIPVSVWLTEVYRRRWKYANQMGVREGTEYPNNHHLLGVGYFHAAAGVWFVHPWNEFREGLGFFWEGEWHPEPDLRQVLPSLPAAGEVERANAAWRKADPDRMAQFWGRVERGGFGTAVERREGS